MSSLIGVTVWPVQGGARRLRARQDKQYLVGFAQLPDGATLDRTEEVIRRMGEIALKQPGVESAVAFPGLSINGFTNSSNAGIVFVDAEAVRRAQGADLSGRRHRQAAEPEVRRDPGRLHRDVPAAAGAGPRHHRRLQAADRGPRRARLRGAGRRDEGVHRQGVRQAPELAGLFSSYQINVPQLYADIDRTKARQLGVPVTDVFDTHADLSRLAVRQRLQQVRPHLLGARAGRRAVPRARRRHRAAEGALRHRRDGAAVGAAEGQAERRAGARHALQRLPRRRHQRRRRRPAIRRPGAGRDRAHRGRDAAARASASNGPS